MNIQPAIKNQSYYKTAPDEYAAQRCKLDVYLPENTATNIPATEIKKPVLVFFHGGGLEINDRSECLSLVRALLKKDIAIAIADYRLAPKAKVPDFIEDAAAAVSWGLDNTEIIGADPDKIFCGGYSAGAYLAAMIIQDGSYLEKHNHHCRDLAGLIAVSGQMVTHKQVRKLLGKNENKTIVDKYAPIHHVKGETIPTLAIVGDNDMPARLEENRYWMKLRELEGECFDKLIVQEARNHGTIIFKSDDPEEATNKAIINFIKEIEEYYINDLVAVNTTKHLKAAMEAVELDPNSLSDRLEFTSRAGCWDLINYDDEIITVYDPLCVIYILKALKTTPLKIFKDCKCKYSKSGTPVELINTLQDTMKRRGHSIDHAQYLIGWFLENPIKHPHLLFTFSCDGLDAVCQYVGWNWIKCIELWFKQWTETGEISMSPSKDNFKPVRMPPGLFSKTSELISSHFAEYADFVCKYSNSLMMTSRQINDLKQKLSKLLETKPKLFDNKAKEDINTANMIMEIIDQTD